MRCEYQIILILIRLSNKLDLLRFIIIQYYKFNFLHIINWISAYRIEKQECGVTSKKKCSLQSNENIVVFNLIKTWDVSSFYIWILNQYHISTISLSISFIIILSSKTSLLFSFQTTKYNMVWIYQNGD